MTTTNQTKDKKKTKAAVEDKPKPKAPKMPPGPRVCPHCGGIVPSPVQRAPRAKPEELTDQQLKVLRLIAAGHTAQQIGDALGLSRRTAEFHRGAIMNKLGLRTTSELTMYALANSVIHVS